MLTRCSKDFFKCNGGLSIFSWDKDAILMSSGKPRIVEHGGSKS